MNKIVINSTEGGAQIKGTIQLSLKEVIKKYCQKPIDKSKIEPLLTFADNGDELIEKVIPLLKNDINNLEEIITNSRKGMAISHGIKTLIAKPEYQKLLPKKKKKLFDRLNQETIKIAKGNSMVITQIFFQKVIAKLKKSKLKSIMILSNKNFMFSEAAHIAAIKNPLVNVAIYGASRAIQTRALKADGGINHFLMNKNDAIIRTTRNIIILKAAYIAATGLKKSYKKTLALLKKYHRTKNNNLLVSSKKESINLNDAENYFEAGNWAHPYIDSKKYIEQKEYSIEKYEKAKQIFTKAIKMKNEAIKKAKESEIKHHDKMTKLVKYNELLKDAKKAGATDKNFDEALRLMKKAIKLLPDKSEAQWGLATSFHHAGNIKESLKEYKKLIDKFPDTPTFQFEYGQVLLKDNQLQQGLKEIGKAMAATNEFDYFMMRLGEIYEHTNQIENALTAYTAYLKNFPFDFEAWTKKGNCLSILGKKVMALNAYKKALDIKPDYEPAINAMEA